MIFSASASDIERKVEEYRQSLLIRKIEQYYIDNEPNSIVTDADIEEYYNDALSELENPTYIYGPDAEEIGVST